MPDGARRDRCKLYPHPCGVPPRLFRGVSSAWPRGTSPTPTPGVPHPRGHGRKAMGVGVDVVLGPTPVGTIAQRRARESRRPWSDPGRRAGLFVGEIGQHCQAGEENKRGKKTRRVGPVRGEIGLKIFPWPAPTREPGPNHGPKNHLMQWPCRILSAPRAGACQKSSGQGSRFRTRAPKGIDEATEPSNRAKGHPRRTQALDLTRPHV